MKIAYFINQYPKVSHTFIRREILALEKLGYCIERYALRGWDADIVDPDDKIELTRTHFLLRAGVRGLMPSCFRSLWTNPMATVRALGVALAHWRAGDRSLILNLVTLAEACLLHAWLQSAGIRHLHVHFGTNSALIALLVHTLGSIDYSFTIHGPEEWDSPARLRLREKVAAAKFVVTISSYTRGQLLRWARPSDHAKIAVVHCGIDQSFASPAILTPPQGRRFVCVGRLCVEKSQMLLVAAMAQLVAEGVDAELVLAGDGDMRREIESEIQRLRLSSRIRITGWISGAQVRDELLASRALLLPSLAEGLPVVIMEAMALGRPVLTTYIAGIPELIQDREHGWLFASGSIDAIVQAMRQCLDTPTSELATMGQASRERVAQRHSIDTEAKKLAQLFERVSR